ncbi:hypothetical protein B0H13DRAFT_2540449 [Mycena leptocephala]|nr:hypothetical protein B0H13DRAFT_2540449 [Mycena leptocephala]
MPAVAFSLNTYKHHAMGDYGSTIRRYGTTDSYSTQIGKLQHRIVKRWNGRSNKNNAIPQIIKMDVRETAHERMQQELTRLLPQALQEAKAEPEPILVEQHHRIARDESNKIYLSDWLPSHAGDPAFKDFLPRLKGHLYARMQNTGSIDATNFSPDQLATVNIQHNRILQHATAAFNYTTYDVRRDQDIINANTERCHVMVKSNEENEDGLAVHPYWYARVLGVFHVNVFPPKARAPRRYEFLWVRWLGRDPEWKSGPSHLCLDRIGYVPETDAEAFGFLDPSLVLRACHLSPAFALGKTTSLLGPSAARDFTDGDWLNYYVMRDMMMRYLGIGVGHMQPADFPSEVGADLHLLMEQYSEYDIPVSDQQSAAPETGEVNGPSAEDQPLRAEDIESDEEGGDEERDGGEEDDNDEDYVLLLPDSASPESPVRQRRLPEVSSRESWPPALMDTSNRRVSRADPRGSFMQYESASHYEGSDREETRDDSPTPPAARSNTHKRGAPRSGLSDEENTPQNTKQVRSRPNEPTSDTEDDSEPESLGINDLPYQTELRRKGRMAARMISPDAHWPTVLAAGLRRNPDRNDNEDRFTQNIKKAIPIWYPHWSPVYNSNTKHEMGFRHPNCGKWLCPADLDWEDEKIQQELRDGTIVPGPEDFNRGLFFNEDPDPEDLMSGFLKSDALVRAYTHIFISPTSALAEDGPDKSKGKGNAAEHNMTEATLESIYYVAHVLHFCFSSQSTFQAKGGNGHFSYRNYFKWLQKSVSEWPASDQEDLLTWWNKKVFSQSVVQPKKRTDGSLSIAERMRAQAAAKAAAEQSAILSRGSGATAADKIIEEVVRFHTANPYLFTMILEIEPENLDVVFGSFDRIAAAEPLRYRCLYNKDIRVNADKNKPSNLVPDFQFTRFSSAGDPENLIIYWVQAPHVQLVVTIDVSIDPYTAPKIAKGADDISMEFINGLDLPTYGPLEFKQHVWADKDQIAAGEKFEVFEFDITPVDPGDVAANQALDDALDEIAEYMSSVTLDVITKSVFQECFMANAPFDLKCDDSCTLFARGLRLDALLRFREYHGIHVPEAVIPERSASKRRADNQADRENFVKKRRAA